MNLRCEDIRKDFGGVEALSDVTLDFDSGGAVALMGPNGAGKTTLLNILTGFETANSGACFLGGRRLDNLSPEAISRLGIARTFQDLRLVRQARSLENVMLAFPNQRGERLPFAVTRWGVAREEAKNLEEAMQLLMTVGISDQSNNWAGNLSYGQQKLLSLACCVATGAHTLLLDEPIAGVHPALAAEILIFLRNMCEQGRRIVFIEHDREAVRQLADRVVVLSAGSVIADGSPNQVLNMPEVFGAYVS